MRTRIILALLVGALIIAGCSKNGPPGPTAEFSPPTIHSVSAIPSQVAPSESSTLTCEASDPDSDTLIYTWSTTAGSIEGHSSSATWTAPCRATVSEIQACVSDGHDGVDSMIVEITVLDDSPRRILVDASRDGGVWWSPQSALTGFSESESHQGKALADYIRSLGFRVDELPRGVMITDSLLCRYDKVIRAGKCGAYAESELQAYESFLHRTSSLILISEFLRPGGNDQLAERLGITFAGLARGFVTRFADHSITEDAVPFHFNAGSVVIDAGSNPNIECLGWLSDDIYVDLNGNDLQDPDEPTGCPVMGVLHHPTSRIFFLGEINGIETVPQPLVNNLIHWAFQ